MTPDSAFVAPRVLHKVKAEYPAELSRNGVEGDVTASVTIDKEGIPRDCKAVGDNSKLRDLACDALTQWRFEPARMDGAVVEVLFTTTVTFRSGR